MKRIYELIRKELRRAGLEAWSQRVTLAKAVEKPEFVLMVERIAEQVK